MINKLFVLTALLGVMIFGVSGVLADTQTVSGTVTPAVHVTLQTTSIDYGSLNPGSSSVEKDTIFQVEPNNNANYMIIVSLQADSNALFDNIFINVNNANGYEPNEQITFVPAPTFLGTDPNGPDTVTLKSRLDVPTGFSPVVGATGVVIYTIAAQP